MIEKIEELNVIIEKCNMCKLYKTRKNTVKGKGNTSAEIMIIAESPNASEETEKESLNGNTAELLKCAIQTLGIDQDKIYYTNLVKCRPYANKRLEMDEISCCMNYLRNEVLIIKPKIIVLLGDVVSKIILGEDYQNLEINKNNISNKKIIIKKNIKYIMTYNILQILQDENKKVEFLKDLNIINEELKK